MSAFQALGLAVLAASALVGAASLSACGFTPLYAQPGVTAGMTHIDVVAPRGRVGYLLTEDLNNAFGHTPGEAPAYRLEMVLVQNRGAHGLTSNDVAQRYELDLQVIYTLLDLSTGKVARTGVVYSNISYDSVDQPYAGIQARTDVQNRLALDLAAKLQTQIAAWLATRRAG